MKIWVDINTETYGEVEDLRILNLAEEALKFAEEIGGDITGGLTRLAVNEGSRVPDKYVSENDPPTFWESRTREDVDAAQELAIDLLVRAGYSSDAVDEADTLIEDRVQFDLQDAFLRAPQLADKISHLLEVARTVDRLQMQGVFSPREGNA